MTTNGITSGALQLTITPLKPPEAKPPAREIRVVADPVPMLDTAKFEHMQRIATIMAETSMIPDSLRMGKVEDEDGKMVEAPLPSHRVQANCFMVVNQAVRWGMDPFAVAQCASVVYGRLMWEGKLVAAVLDANLGVRLNYTFSDHKAGDQQLAVTVSGTIPGETEPRTISGRVINWHKGPKSPWANEGSWKRQLRYMGAREWARAHAPAIMLGVIADDEADEGIGTRTQARGPKRPVATKAPLFEIPDESAVAETAKPAEPTKQSPPAKQVVNDPIPEDDGWPGPK